MATNLMNVFKTVDLQGVGKTAANIVSLAFKPNKKTGAKIARAVLDDGTTLILADVPIIEKDEDQKEYSTIPVGFIIVRDEYFITVSLMENQVIRRMNPMKNKSVATYKKSRLVLQCLYVNSEIYLNLLNL